MHESHTSPGASHPIFDSCQGSRDRHTTVRCFSGVGSRAMCAVRAHSQAIELTCCRVILEGYSYVAARSLAYLAYCGLPWAQVSRGASTHFFH
eukprot:7163174-Prymnesium_polylepis.2